MTAQPDDATGRDEALKRFEARFDWTTLGSINVAIEGAVDYAFGRPFQRNPYQRELQPPHDDWAAGWLLAEAGTGFPHERRWLTERRDRYEELERAGSVPADDAGVLTPSDDS